MFIFSIIFSAYCSFHNTNSFLILIHSLRSLSGGSLLLKHHPSCIFFSLLLSTEIRFFFSFSNHPLLFMLSFDIVSFSKRHLALCATSVFNGNGSPSYLYSFYGFQWHALRSLCVRSCVSALKRDRRHFN